jgi:uncharacterized RmlC-like cupin family protein
MRTQHVQEMTDGAVRDAEKSLNEPDEVAHYDLISKENVVLDGVEVHRVTFAPGAKWSHDLKPHAGTESCELPHVAYVAAGKLEVVMDDGSRECSPPAT